LDAPLPALRWAVTHGKNALKKYLKALNVEPAYAGMS